VRANTRATFANAVMLSATVLAPALLIAPAFAQAPKDFRCTGNHDIPRDDQITRCTDAIGSGKFTGKDLGESAGGGASALRCAR